MSLHTPNSPTSIPPPASSKKSVFSSSSSLVSGSTRRASTSSVGGGYNPGPSGPTQGIGYSPGAPGTTQPTPTTPASSGIPSFRTLRSFLPFGAGKNAPTTPAATPATPSKSHFGFGSVRKSIQKERERKGSLSSDAAMLPIISIGTGAVTVDPPIRRSVSFSGLENPNEEPHPEKLLSMPEPAGDARYTLRTPSPGPLLSAELSTIIEADSSGVSKHIPMLSMINDTSSDTFPPPSGPYTTTFPDTPVIIQPPRASASEYDTDLSALKLSTEDLASEVRDALRKSQSSGKQWRAADAAIVIDADDMAGDTTFHLDRGELDSDLAALLKSNGAGPRRPIAAASQTTYASRRFGTSSQTPSPTTPTFPSHTSSPSSTHITRARQASSLLPRLRPSIHGGPPSNSPSPTSAAFVVPSPTGPGHISPNTPRASPARPKLSTVGAIAVNGYDYYRTEGSNTSFPPTSPPPTKTTTSVVSSTPTHAPASARRLSNLGRPVRLFGSATTPTPKEPVLNANPTPSTSSRQPPTRTLRQVMTGVSRTAGEGDGNGNTKTPTPATYAVDRKGASGAPATPTAASSAAILSRQSLDLPRRPFGGSATDLGLGRPSLDVPMRSSGYTQGHPSGPSPRRSLEGRRPMPENELMGGIAATGIRRATTPTPAPQPMSRKVSGSASPERPPTILPSDESSSPSPGTQDRRGGAPGYGHGKHGHVKGASVESDTAGRPSFESARPSSRAGASSRMVRERERGEDADTARTLSTRSRKRSMSVQERIANGRSRHSVAGTGGNAASESGERYGGPRPGSSLSVRTAPGPSSERGAKRLEWLGPRTAKAFRAAGLLDFEKDRDPGKERDRLDVDRERDMDRDPGSPFGSTMNRFGYNPSVHGRMAFSDVGGPTLARRGSESHSGYSCGYGHGLMESPTLTTSSRETPKSSLGSTAPTSLHSLETFGYPLSTPRNGSSDPHIVREREHQNELAALKDKHSTETGALLNALSDSQRIAKVLREENGELRMRIERMGEAVREGEALVRTLNELKEENEALRRELAAALTSSSGSGGSGGRQRKSGGGLTPSWSIGSSASSASGYRTPATRGGTSPLVRSYTPRTGQHELDDGIHPPLPPAIRVLDDDKAQEEQHEEATATYSGTFIDHGSQAEDTTFEMDEDRDYADRSMVQGGDDDDAEADLDILPASLSTKAASRHPSLRKRSSDTSSIFPSVPSNMTMLLHDDASAFAGFGSDSQRSSIDPSLNGRGAMGDGGSKRSSAYSKTHSRASSKSEERDDTLTRPSMPVGVGIGPGTMSAYQAFIESASGSGARNPFNQSIGNQSGMSVSPGTDSFSMATGSPGSLFLRPEHEDLLDDMESLDLGTRADLDRQLELALGIRREEDEW